MPRRDNTRSHTLALRITPAEYRELKKAANAAVLDVSAWARQQLLWLVRSPDAKASPVASAVEPSSLIPAMTTSSQVPLIEEVQQTVEALKDLAASGTVSPDRLTDEIQQQVVKLDFPDLGDRLATASPPKVVDLSEQIAELTCTPDDAVHDVEWTPSVELPSDISDAEHFRRLKEAYERRHDPTYHSEVLSEPVLESTPVQAPALTFESHSEPDVSLSALLTPEQQMKLLQKLGMV